MNPACATCKSSTADLCSCDPFARTGYGQREYEEDERARGRGAAPRRMHYAGALTVRGAKRVVNIDAGWAACSTGSRAVAIRERGEATHDKAAVTCQVCLSLIAKAEVAS